MEGVANTEAGGCRSVMFFLSPMRAACHCPLCREFSPGWRFAGLALRLLRWERTAVIDFATNLLRYGYEADTIEEWLEVNGSLYPQRLLSRPPSMPH